MSQPSSKPPVVPAQYLLPFILTTCCFSLWGFANDFTNPLVKVFEQVFVIGTSEASWLQFAFYTGYFCMAIPAVFFIRRFSYKGAIMLGFAFYAIGALLAIPASLTATFGYFLLASYIITYGLAFLETACNPYILSMGPAETATQRLNLAQAFNPIGSLTGMAIATLFLAPNLEVGKFRSELGEKNPEYTKYLVVSETSETEANADSTSDLTWNDSGSDKEHRVRMPEGASVNSLVLRDGSEVDIYKNGLPDFDSEVGALDKATPNALKMFRDTNPNSFNDLQQTDLGFVRTPYVVIACVVTVFLGLFAITKMPGGKDQGKDAPFMEITARIFRIPHFREGVLAQLFYVGAQIMCWTFIIHYGMEQVGLTLGQAQIWNIVAMVIFLCSRFICTFLLRIINPGKLLGIFAIGGILFTIGAIYLSGDTFSINVFGKWTLVGNAGLLSLVMISACMSLMFPTIYGIALKSMKQEEAKLGSAYLIMSIVGGAVLTKLQGGLIDSAGVRTSFWLPAACFVLIAIFGFRSMARDRQLTQRPHPDSV